MNTIGYVGNIGLTSKDLECIVKNLQSNGTYAIPIADESDYEKGFRAGLEAGYMAAKEET